MKLHAHLNFGGNCKEAFEFYEKHLGGKVNVMLTHSDHPGLNTVPDKSSIMYASMSLAQTEIIGNDVPSDHFQPMRSTYLSLTVDSIEEAERAHGLLAEGGQIFMPMEETFFAHRFSSLRDQFGTLWMILHPKAM